MPQDGTDKGRHDLFRLGEQTEALHLIFAMIEGVSEMAETRSLLADLADVVALLAATDVRPIVPSAVVERAEQSVLAIVKGLEDLIRRDRIVPRRKVPMAMLAMMVTMVRTG